MATTYFTDLEKAALDFQGIPSHIAIIPDGNRRWAEKQSKEITQGHQSGADGLMDIIRAAKELKVKTVTVYTFSTENWKRDPDEVNALMWLIQTYLLEEKDEMIDGGVKLATIGDLSIIPQDVRDTIAYVKDATKDCSKITMVLAINYGSRDEICRAVTRLVDDYSQGKVQGGQITESLITSYLDTSHWDDPDLVIRTSGEMRLSNFLLWQASYSEIYTTDVYWPDFKPHHLLEAVLSFQQRKRRIGS